MEQENNRYVKQWARLIRKSHIASTKATAMQICHQHKTNILKI
jgi:hypothetical protein